MDWLEGLVGGTGGRWRSTILLFSGLLQSESTCEPFFSDRTWRHRLPSGAEGTVGPCIPVVEAYKKFELSKDLAMPSTVASSFVFIEATQIRSFCLFFFYIYNTTITTTTMRTAIALTHA